MKKIIHYLKRAVSMPPHIVAQKAFAKFSHRYNEARKRKRDITFPTYGPAGFTRGRVLVPRKMDLAKALSLVPVSLVLEKSHRIMAHEFNLLGSGWMKVNHGAKCAGLEGGPFEQGGKVTADSEGRWLQDRINEKNLSESRRLWGLIEQNYEPVDWQLDFKSGYRWSERILSRDIIYGQTPGQDVKLPWELARMQHLPALAWAYGLASQKAPGFQHPALYAQEFRNELLDFMATNPPRYGVNWACTMDVGIRVANWVLAYDLFRSLGAAFDAPFEEALGRSVYEHAYHIRHHLEWDPFLRSNHYLADIAGLVFAMAHLGTYPETDVWFRFAQREFEKEVSSQFQEDGSNFEASTSYHRLSLEMVLSVSALLLGYLGRHIKTGTPFGIDYWDKLLKAGGFVKAITKPGGQVVQVGDNDSGRFIALRPSVGPALDHRYLLGELNGLLDHPDLFEYEREFGMEAEFFRQLAHGNKIRFGSKEEESELLNLSPHPDFGLYPLAQGPWRLWVRCGSVGQKGNGGHAHNDQLSFELCVDSQSLLVDPGTYVYTPLPEERNKFRSTAMHNTLSLNGLEQNPFGPELFRLLDSAHSRVIEFRGGLFIGEHKGFGPVHRRTLQVDEKGLTGLDECKGEGTKRIYFHAAPGWEARIEDAHQARLIRGSNKVKFQSVDGEWSVEDGFYSGEYGKKEAVKVLVLKSTLNSIAWKIQKGEE